MRAYWARTIIHPTWNFTVLCIGVVLGVVSGAWWQGPGIVLLPVGAVLFLLSIVRHRRFLLIFALFAGMLIGNWRGGIEQQAYAQYHAMYGKHVRLSGVIGDDVDNNTRGQAIVHLAEVHDGTRPIDGKVWLSLGIHEAEQFKRGDRLLVDGVLEQGFGTYAASMYLPAVIAASREQSGDAALAVRDSFAGHVARAIHEPAASLGIGFLLGQKRGLPQQLIEALQVAGLTHIVVASGYNLTILVRLARRLFEKTSKYLAMLSGALLIVGFIAITGLSPSMTRAGLVAGLGLWAWYWGRRFHPLTLLVFAMALTVLWSPSYVWGDVGWALSFAAFGGVMLLAPLLQAYFYGEEKPPFVMQLIIETISAQLATAPIILMVFGQFSNVALLSNLLILPFIPLAMLLVAIAGVGAYVVPAMAPMLGWPAETLLKAMVWVIEKTASIEWAQSSWHIEAVGLGMWYAALIAIGGYIIYRTRFKLHRASVVE